jgi:hypothetical protein
VRNRPAACIGTRYRCPEGEEVVLACQFPLLAISRPEQKRGRNLNQPQTVLAANVRDEGSEIENEFQSSGRP